MEIVTKNNYETINAGAELAKCLNDGDVVCLYGGLGAGKTTLVKGIALGLGIKDEIVSPTFTLMNIYNIKTLKHKNIKTLVHIDTYRFKDANELVQIGALDYIGQPDTIAIIEWPDKIAGLLKNKKVINVSIDHQGETARTITLTKSIIP